MRRIVISMIAVGALTLACDQAFAKYVSISGTHSASEIKSACDKAGGLYSQDSGGYGCQTNCKGGPPGNGPSGCAVGCKSDGKCTGEVPGRTTGKSGLGKVLGNGAAINRATKKTVHTPSSAAGHRTNTRGPHTSTSNAQGGAAANAYDGHGGGRAHPKPTVRDHRTEPVVRDHRSEPVVRDHRSQPVVRDHR